MPNVNDFLTWALDPDANVETQEQYIADTARGPGVTAGTAKSDLYNKAQRQSAFWASTIAQFILNQLSVDVLDDGDQAAKITLLQNAILKLTSVYAPLASPALTGNPTTPNQAGADNSTKIANTAFVQTAITTLTGIINTALAAKANLASPAFSGNPTAPTPAPGDNDTSVSTTAFVTAAITAAVAALAPIANPHFTGDPQAPNQAFGDNDQSIANTAFVQSAVTAAVAAFGNNFSLNLNNPGHLTFFGLQIKWLQGAFHPTNGPDGFTEGLLWDIAFPNACMLAVVGTRISSTTIAGDAMWQYINPDQFGITNLMQQMGNLSGTSIQANIVAFGY